MLKLKSSFSRLMPAIVMLVALCVVFVVVSHATSTPEPSLVDIKSTAGFEAGQSYAISDATGLYLLAQRVNDGENTKDVSFVLTADITLNTHEFSESGNWSAPGGSPAPFSPIGNAIHPFLGSFDGNGHTISGLYIEKDDGFVGFFGSIVDGSVENLKIENSYIAGTYYVGGIAGYILSINEDCVIKNCEVSIYTSTHDYFVGAIVGYAASMGDGRVVITDSKSVSNAPMAGVDGINSSGNSETVTPLSDGDGSFAWLLILLVILAVVLAVCLLVFLLKKFNIFNKKEKEESDNASAPEEHISEEMSDKPAEEDNQEDEQESEQEPEEEPEHESEEEPEEATDTEAEQEEDTQDTEDEPHSTVLAMPDIGESTKALGYYYIKQTADGGYMFSLKAANHEIIATSEIYTTLASCKKGVQSVAKNAPVAAIEDLTIESEEKVYAPKFEIYADKAEKFRFRLKAANYEIIAVSQAYKKKPSCRKAVMSVAHNAQTKKIIVEDAKTGARRESLRAEITRAEKITPEEANSLIDDVTAEVLLETISGDGEPIKEYTCELVYTDMLSDNFAKGDLVNTEILIEKGLIPASTKHIKVIARGTLDKALTIEANQFSIDAVKMIILTGGTAVKTND